ncbi:hypothetical protein MUP77_17720 [Candidatus Bathyarchaeota archaeon]|nr:hypothetical protein [Candidatus Bathyarchaeota archaeon]
MKKVPKRWTQLKRIVEKLRNGGLYYPRELMKELKLSNRTVDACLKHGIYIGIFKQEEERGPYSWVDYEAKEEIIRQVIKDHCPYGVKAALQSKYRPSSDLFDEICKDAGIITGNDPDDPKFKRLVFKTFSKLLDDNSRTMSKPP